MSGRAEPHAGTAPHAGAEPHRPASPAAGGREVSTALVTGATSGIGKEIARQLGERGWQVLVGARELARGHAVAAEVGGRALLIDVTDAASIARAASEV